MSLPQKETHHVHTIDSIYALPEGTRAELIDGILYNMAPPNTIHQRLVMNLSAEIRNYIKNNRRNCEVFPAPFAVFLNADGKNYVEPDISVICDRDKIDERGCNGAPDWVIEVVSPGTQRMDYFVKLFKYRSAGVRRYWIVNPMKQTVQVYSFEGDGDSAAFSFQDTIRAGIYDDFEIKITDLLE